MEIHWNKLNDNVSVAHFPSIVSKQQIYVKKVQSAKVCKTTVFLFHDLGAYHGRFMNMIHWFQEHHPEIAFIMMDFVGHGLSTGTRGHLSLFDDAVSDAQRLFESFNKNEDEQWVALGNGLGALVLLDLLNRAELNMRGKINGLVLSNFVFNFDSPGLRLQNQLYERLTARGHAFFDHLRFFDLFPPEMMVSSNQERMELMDDPLMVHRPTFASIRGVLEKVNSVYQHAYFIDMPTLVLESSGPLLSKGGTTSFSKGIKKNLLTQKSYLNLRHDLYNDNGKHAVFTDIAEWVRK